MTFLCSRSLNLVTFKIGCGFLIAFHSNYGAILYCLHDTARYWLKSANFFYYFIRHLYLAPPQGVIPSDIRKDVWHSWNENDRATVRHVAWYTSPYLWSRSVGLVPGWMSWLAEISADLREALVHQTMRWTNPALLYFALLYRVVKKLWQYVKPFPTLTVPARWSECVNSAAFFSHVRDLLSFS